VVLEAIAPDGYSGEIRLLVGIHADGRIAGVRVTAHKETPGLGDYIDPARSPWIRQFDGRSLRPPARRPGKCARTAADFDYLAGATITPRAVVKAVRQALQYFEPTGRNCSPRRNRRPDHERNPTVRPRPPTCHDRRAAPPAKGGLFSQESRDIIVNGLWTQNPGIVQLLGLCPLLAISSSVVNSLSLGLATTLVMAVASGSVALLRNFIPHEIRIPAFVLIIAALVTVVNWPCMPGCRPCISCWACSFP
jgi:hypothetical protein